MKTLTRHPARYTDALLPIFAQIIPTYSRGLDPFGGTGKINVTQFHEEALRSVGFTWLGSEQVKCPGNRFGQNGGARIEYETVAWFQKPERR